MRGRKPRAAIRPAYSASLTSAVVFPSSAISAASTTFVPNERPAKSGVVVTSVATPRATSTICARGHRVRQDELAVEPVGHVLPHEVEVPRDDLGVVIILRVLRLRRTVLFLAGWIKELKRKLTRVRKILARHLLELVEPAHRAVEIEREDEIAEDYVGPCRDQRLRHAEAVERADHQHARVAQHDTGIAFEVRDRLALECVLEPAPVHHRRVLHRAQQLEPVTHRVTLRPRVQVDVDAAEADGVDRAVQLAQSRERAIERSVHALAPHVELFPEQFDARAMIARRRSKRHGNDGLHACNARRAARVAAMRSGVIAVSNARMPASVKPARSASASISRTLARSMPRPSV
jgi:hypothetical protein